MPDLPRSLPTAHRQFLEGLVRTLSEDRRVVGIAAGGSYLEDAMDAFSDLDLVVAVEPGALGGVMVCRRDIAASLGNLLAAFSGEHVGESRLLICLYDQPLLHVDLKFVDLDGVAERVEDPAVLWQRDGRMDRALSRGRAVYPMPDPEWIEARFWIWVHCCAAKIGRGELFEALDCLSFLRATVLGPLALRRAGARPTGVRKLETAAPGFAARLRDTVAAYDAADCLRALRACVDLYRWLLPAESRASGGVEAVVMAYLDEIEDRT